MDAWLIVVVVLIFVLLIIGILFAIFYSPNYQQKNPKQRPKQGLTYIMATRGQLGDDILPAIPIRDTPTSIELNISPCEDTKYVKVTRTGLYNVAYGVDINFANTATASVSVRRRSCKANSAFEVIAGSVRQVAVNNAMLMLVNNTFLAQLNAGDLLQLTAVSNFMQSNDNQADIVTVPPSNATFLQTPETLASLVLTLVP